MQSITVFLTFGMLLGFLVLGSNFASPLLLIGAPFSVAMVIMLPACYSKARRLCQHLQWWHYMWALMLLSGLVFRIRDTSVAAEAPLDTWALYRMALIVAIGMVLFYHLVVNRTDWFRSLSQGVLAFLSGYAALSIFSATWSVYPSWSLYKSIEYSIDLALIAAIIAAVRDIRGMKTLLDWTWFLLAIVLSTVWFWVVVRPEDAVLHKIGILGLQIQGVWPAIETNGVGELGAILGIVAFARLLFSNSHRSRLLYFLVLMVSGSTIIFAQSRSPLMAFLLAIPVVLFMSKRIGGLTLAFTTAVIMFLSTSASEPMWEYFQRGQKDRDFESLSGRTVLWNAAWVLIQNQPLHGYGAYAGTRFTGINDAMGTGISSILNTWLEVLLGVGLPGFLLLAIAFVRMWIILFSNTWQASNDSPIHQLGVEAMGILTIITVRSMFSPQLIWHPPMTFLLILGYAEFVRRLQKDNAHENPYSPQLLSAVGR